MTSPASHARKPLHCLAAMIGASLMVACNKPMLVLIANESSEDSARADATVEPDQDDGNGSTARRGVYTIAAGRDHSCAILDGNLYCWGSNLDGQLGQAPDEDMPDVPLPTAVDSSQGWIDVACGAKHTCGLNLAGDVYCWGSNLDGQLGDDSTQPHYRPEQVELDLPAERLWSGSHHTCALLGGGAVYCWGRNSFGQLGQGDEADMDSYAPRPVRLGRPDQVFKEGFAGTQHTCVVALEGGMNLWCTGNNDLGQLGLRREGPDQTRRLTEVPDLYRVASGAAGAQHSCAITQQGELYCWGDAFLTGLGSTDDTTANELNKVPVLVPQLSDVTDVSLSESGGCAVAQREVLCWGSNADGQLALGEDIYIAHEATEVPTPLEVAEVAMGSTHVCVLSTSHTVACAGRNHHGEIGDGSLRQRWTLRTIANQTLD